jgi:hypothetical protein
MFDAAGKITKLISRQVHQLGGAFPQLAVRDSSQRQDSLGQSLRTPPMQQWDWKLILSTPERALLELLDELPPHETFHRGGRQQC